MLDADSVDIYVVRLGGETESSFPEWHSRTRFLGCSRKITSFKRRLGTRKGAGFPFYHYHHQVFSSLLLFDIGRSRCRHRLVDNFSRGNVWDSSVTNLSSPSALSCILGFKCRTQHEKDDGVSFTSRGPRSFLVKEVEAECSVMLFYLSWLNNSIFLGMFVSI